MVVNDRVGATERSSPPGIAAAPERPRGLSGPSVNHYVATPAIEHPHDLGRRARGSTAASDARAGARRNPPVR